MKERGEIVQTVLRQYPDTQAIYLFGSYGTEDEWPDSDVDIALLLPPLGVRQHRLGGLGLNDGRGDPLSGWRSGMRPCPRRRSGSSYWPATGTGW